MSSNSYSSRIKSPEDLGASDNGKIKYLVKDIKALMSYVDVLIGSGPWNGLRGGEDKSIGSSSFYKTRTKCKNIDSSVGESVDRYVYNDTIPTSGNKSLMFSIEEDIENLNPLNLLDGLKRTENKCKKVKLLCREPDGSPPSDDDVEMDEDNNAYLERAVNIEEIEDIDPCMFFPENGKRVNPITKKSCREGFSTFKKNKFIQNIYNLLIGLLFLYILIRVGVGVRNNK